MNNTKVNALWKSRWPDSIYIRQTRAKPVKLECYVNRLECKFGCLGTYKIKRDII